MRILIDLQACQSTGSRTRGIGRYSLALAKAMVRQAGKHEVHLALNGAFGDAIPDLRREFSQLLPHQHIHTWRALTNVSAANPSVDARRIASELLREEAFAQLRPDIIHVSSLFEGLGDDAVTNVHALNRASTAVTLYDLIPLIHRQQYLGDRAISRWYYQKIQALKNADLLLAISNSSRDEALNFLQLPASNVVNISSAVDERFVQRTYAPAVLDKLLQKYGLKRRFVMYTGGIDLRKNIERLIAAYAQLPMELRKQHQLAVVCSVHQPDRQRLMQLATSLGLAQDELVLTGFVADDELPLLYQACQLFVFPSWHEGFGLPALEAMNCGAPVITSNTSSLPEVIGLPDAMFDPFQEASITQKMVQALSDEDFRRRLSRHGLERAKLFSWDACAKTAIAAFEARFDKQQSANTVSVPIRRNAARPKLAYISPLPPEKTGIADYSAELLPELARHYDIHVVSDQVTVADPWLSANFPLHSVAWFRKHGKEFDRVLYHVGNSTYHSHMFDLLREHPGVVVLHDFYISNLVSHLDHTGEKPGFWVESLYQAHGYPALARNAQCANVHDVIWEYPCNRAIVDPARGVIVHSQFSLELAKRWYGQFEAKQWTYIPHLRCLPETFSRQSAKLALGFQEADFVVCAFGMLGPTKLNHALLRAWHDSSLSQDPHCYLVFVGQNDGGEYGETTLHLISADQSAGRVRLTGFATPEMFKSYLQASDLAVQLRTKSRGETSGTVLDCMAHGIATIINANGTMAELPDDALLKLQDQFVHDDLVQALTNLYQNLDQRRALGQKAIEHIRHFHQPHQIGSAYQQAIEKYYIDAEHTQRDLLYSKLQDLVQSVNFDDAVLRDLAIAIAGNAASNDRRLLIDVSRLAEVDANSGIQRVVRAIVTCLMNDALFDGRIEPVVLSPEGLRYARTFGANLLGSAALANDGDLVEVSENDIFLGLDLHFEPIIANRDMLQSLRNRGMRMVFVIYDLLPLLQPSFFEPQLVINFQAWLSTVVELANGAICISKSVKVEVQTWLEQNKSELAAHFALDYFHLGADITEELAVVPDSGDLVPSGLDQAISFLMVGTVEPRKGHTQSLEAFEQLWLMGAKVSLVIVGGRGWKTEELQTRIASHPELGQRLFWFDQADDAQLARLYQQCDCLLASSFGEGFGLPLIEAARYQMPILARRIPVFEEVAGQHVSYFDASTSAELAQAIRDWMQLRERNAVPMTTTMPWLNWRSSTEQLCAGIDRLLPPFAHRINL
ncbi:glycosyltransferase [Undibacterium fentianense]|uniref:Glycosyltransferase n=1 Tax=Undibacterium fentianense TaxID=2828728 RepID=A0A941E846_9BURK|nr:glycosyltransferase [Undibacterium fentianense]MBR7801478.1 glycosyltransferase [Undibacterium fentianense]